MDRFLSTRSEVDLPFKRARRVYNRISNWCVAISAGTLLWSIGNFDKFIVKAGVTEYIPHREIYILFLCLFFASTVIFTILRGYVYVHDYYDMRLRDISDIEERNFPSKSNEIRPLPSEAENKFYNDLPHIPHVSLSRHSIFHILVQTTL